MRKKIVSVIGGRSCTVEVEQQASNLGKYLTEVVDILAWGHGFTAMSRRNFL